jgi:hypothetical protein
MSRREQSLSERREELVARSAAQRAALSADAAPLIRQAATADRILTKLRRYPVVIGAVAAGVALLGSRRIFDLASRALTLYALLRR